MKKNKLNEKMINPQPEPPGSHGMINPQPEPPGSHGMINPQPEPPKPQSKLDKVGINPQPEPPKPAGLSRSLKIVLLIGIGVVATAVISYYVYRSMLPAEHG